MITKWLERIVGYYKDKYLAEKCGLDIKIICTHEEDFNAITIYPTKRCLKCRAYYD